MVMVMTAAIAIGLLALFVGIERMIPVGSHRVEDRLLRYGARRLVVIDESTGETRQQSAAAAAVTGAMGRAIQGRSFTANLQADLARADLKITAAEFVTLQVSIAVLLGALATVLLGNPIALPLLGAAGFYGPKWWVKRRQGGRIKAFNEQLADTVGLMSNSLRSGMSLLQAMEMIAREGTPPTSTEFSRVVREIGLGVGPDAALEHLVRRIKSDDLDLMVTAIMVQHEVGGNLSKILDTIAHTIRERVKIKGEIKAITGQQRMAGYVLVAMPCIIAGILLLIAPSYISKFWNPMGPWTALPVAAVLGICFGWIVIEKIIAIEV